MAKPYTGGGGGGGYNNDMKVGTAQQSVIPTTFPLIANPVSTAGGGGGGGGVAGMSYEKKQKDAAIRAAIMDKLIESGEKDRLMEVLRSRLVECGWRDDLKSFAKELIKGKGLQKLTVDQLVSEVTPRARATVPEGVKAELIQNIKIFLQQTNTGTAAAGGGI